MTDKLIHFNSKERLLAKVRYYIDTPYELFDQAEKITPLLLKSFKAADEILKLKIIFTLGSLVMPEVIRPLYKLIHDKDESESVRHAAAVQLSIIGGLLVDPAILVGQLKKDLRSPDSFVRACAAFALGWEGNLKAVFALISCLYDDEPDVQQAAVNALSNLKDDRVFSLLVERLEEGTILQKRCILYNLFRFTSYRKQIVKIYRYLIEDKNSDLRYDALLVFHTVADPIEHLELYFRCLKDGNDNLRELVIARLLEYKITSLQENDNQYIKSLLKDSNPRIRRAAIKLYNHVMPETIFS
ncbi:MAG: HEAT repeat domain-containing protein [Desulfobacteraceae bacterium]|nr:HEAT repeat domain-containing protein [Desulfobacteraceae bacterium]